MYMYEEMEGWIILETALGRMAVFHHIYSEQLCNYPHACTAKSIPLGLVDQVLGIVDISRQFPRVAPPPLLSNAMTLGHLPPTCPPTL